MLGEDDDPTNDYHIRPIPKGPSIPGERMADYQDRPGVGRDYGVSGAASARLRTHQHTTPETDKERWARIKIKGYLGVTPADFEWLVEQTKKAVF